MNRSRLVDGARLAWGVSLLLAPHQLVQAAGGHPTRLASGVAQALGVRHVVVAAGLMALRTTWTNPSHAGARRLVRRLAAGVDAAHATSAVGLAALTDEHRAWAADALIAAVFTTATWRTASPGVAGGAR